MLQSLPSAVCIGHVHEDSYTLSDVDPKVYHDDNLPFIGPDHPLSKPENIGTAFTSMVESQSLFLAPKLIGGRYHEDIGNKPIPVMYNMDTASKLGQGSGGRTHEARIYKDHFHFSPLLQHLQGSGANCLLSRSASLQKNTSETATFWNS
jgi:hypothetical protein